MVIRSPMQVDDEFRKKIKKIQEKIMREKGEYKSIPKITRQVIKTPEWAMIENRLLDEIKQFEFKINFDRRNKR